MTTNTEDTTEQNDGIPPARDGEIATIPDLEPGDKIVTKHHGSCTTDRTLTVEEIGTEKQTSSIGDLPSGGEGYVLSGYGTTYHLTTSQSMTGSWQRVNLIWPSRPEGMTVTEIEVKDD